jgi:hypothetical protein
VHGIGPGFTSSPVADPVFVSRVNEHFDISVVEDGTDFEDKVGHPISEQICVHHLVAFNPLFVDAESLLDDCIVQKSV